MRKTIILPLALIAASGVFAWPQQAYAQEGSPVREAQTQGRQEISFGTHQLQKLDYWASGHANAPLVVFVHGGGWKRGDKDMMHDSAKLSHWRSQNYAVASLNYRLVPDAQVEDQAADIASALKHLKDNAQNFGFDTSRIILIGHSAGAHLVSLVGTDPQYLRAADLIMGDIAGIVGLDGAGYDVPWQMENDERMMRSTYHQAFGTNQARQNRLSPVHHTTSANVSEFLLIHVDRENARRQSRQLTRNLRQSGTNAHVRAIDGKGMRGHRQINRDLGKEDYAATPIVDAFLRRIFAQ